jgi:hypothetical protein
MDEASKIKFLSDYLTARNAVRLARIKADNEDMRARVLHGKYRDLMQGFPGILERHLEAVHDFKIPDPIVSHPESSLPALLTR